MIALRSRFVQVTLPLVLALVVVIGAMALILVSINKDPALAVSQFIDGTLGSAAHRSDVLMMALPILLCASGLLLTFSAGLWNIGVERQVPLGAIFATAHPPTPTPHPSLLL